MKEVKTIVVTPTFSYPPIPRAIETLEFARGASESAPATPIEGGTNTVTATVMVRLGY